MEKYTNKPIDLHVHSTASDGTLTPAELTGLAVSSGLAAMALTDHDTTAGIVELLSAAAGTGLEVIPGIELSTQYGPEEVHVVGLFIDPDDPELLEETRQFRETRDDRNKLIVKRLQDHGYEITFDDIAARNPDCTIARPHIARYLADTGQIPGVQYAFDHLIGDTCPCFVDRFRITPSEAVRLIHGAGGLAVLAHPCLYHKLSEAELKEMVSLLASDGLDGIETVYSRNRDGDEARFSAWAAEYGLLPSGGSDFHGSNKPDIALGTGLGDLFVPYAFLEALKTRLALRRQDPQIS